MGKGKARRRRQSNYERAHGSSLELAPPPDGKDVPVPRKLQALMKVMMAPKQKKLPQGRELKHATKSVTGSQNKDGDILLKQEQSVKDPPVAANLPEPQAVVKHDQENVKTSAPAVPNTKKRKRNGELEKFAEKLNELTGLRTRERRKQYLKEKKDKKKKKQKQKLDTEDISLKELYQHEEVKFGEVVQAPPKLPPLRKKKADPLGVSNERLRLQAVEAYRQKRGWKSRPGTSLPQIDQA